MDVKITTNTSSRYSTITTGSQPSEMVSDDTLTDTWIVRDVVGDDNQSYVDVSMKKTHRWPMEFTPAPSL
ncbi:MAG: hypothetical protein IPP80_14545 [Ignavibacteria bacterium]|nr:hypothetical protein [Ignavibacteria bacterium]